MASWADRLPWMVAWLVAWFLVVCDVEHGYQGVIHAAYAAGIGHGADLEVVRSRVRWQAFRF